MQRKLFIKCNDILLLEHIKKTTAGERSPRWTVLYFGGAIFEWYMFVLFITIIYGFDSNMYFWSAIVFIMGQHFFDSILASRFSVASLSSVYAEEAAGTPRSIPMGPARLPPIVIAARTHIAGRFIFAPTTLG